MRWTGPREGEIDAIGRLRAPVPPDRWPYGEPGMHEDHCYLHGGGLWCDCAASDEGEDGYGEGSWPTSPNAVPKDEADGRELASIALLEGS